MAAIFLKISSASSYLIPNMMDMRFPCKAIAKDDTKEFFSVTSSILLAVEFCQQSSTH